MGLGVVFSRLDLHLPPIQHAIGIGVVEQGIGRSLERAWDEQNFVTVNKAISVSIGIVGMGEEVVFTGNDFLAVLKTVVIGVKHARAGGIRLAFPGKTCTGFLEVAQTVRVRIGIGSIGSASAAHR